MIDAKPVPNEEFQLSDGHNKESLLWYGAVYKQSAYAAQGMYMTADVQKTNPYATPGIVETGLKVLSKLLPRQTIFTTFIIPSSIAVLTFSTYALGVGPWLHEQRLARKLDDAEKEYAQSRQVIVHTPVDKKSDGISRETTAIIFTDFQEAKAVITENHTDGSLANVLHGVALAAGCSLLAVGGAVATSQIQNKLQKDWYSHYKTRKENSQYWYNKHVL